MHLNQRACKLTIVNGHLILIVKYCNQVWIVKLTIYLL